MIKKKKNDNPLRSTDELKSEIPWDEYESVNLFTYYCDLRPVFAKEKLEILNIQEPQISTICGVVYVLVVNQRILKIGQSTTTITKRLRSYNTGTQSLRIRGSAGGANFFILQSLLNFNTDAQVYVLLPRHRTWNILGNKGTEAFPSAKIWERVLLEKFKAKYEKLPIGNFQN